MNKLDFFLQALNAGAGKRRRWVLRAFSVAFNDLPEPEAWDIVHRDNKVYGYVPDDNGNLELVLIEGCDYRKIPYIYHDVVGPIAKGQIPHARDVINETTYGEIFLNYIMGFYVSGTIIEYLVGPGITPRHYERIYAERMKSNPEDGNFEEGVLYVDHWKLCGKAAGVLASYEMFIPSLSVHALTPPPNNNALRKKLLEEAGDTISDPVVQARIQDELIKNYKEYIKGTPAEGVIYSNKSIGTAIKRMFLTYGTELGFGTDGRGVLIEKSLSEGIQIDQYPAIVNSLRSGAYSRGALTALAGEDVDLTARAMQNVGVVEGFCGTKDTYAQPITKEYIGRSILVGDERIEITPENFKQYENTIQELFSPLYCKQSHHDVCSVCIGRKLATYENALGSEVGGIPAAMFDAMMGSAHAKEVKLANLKEDFLR